MPSIYFDLVRVLGDASFCVLALMDLRLPDLGRDQTLMFLPCFINELCVKNGNAFCYISDDVREVTANGTESVGGINGPRHVWIYNS